MSEAIKEAEKILKQYYGYDHFREGQIPVIKAVLGGRDVLGIMPTGAGKSLCYQVPALLMLTFTSKIQTLHSVFPVFLQIPDKTVLLPLPDKAFDKSCGEPQPSVLSRSAHQVLSFLLHSS